MTSLVLMTFTGFSGFAMLLTVAPLWAVEGGASTAGSGLVNGVLLLFTVLTQLLVPQALRRFGWASVLTVGLVLLGVPGVLLSLSDGLGAILALSAVRGVGFGVLTVTGSAAVAALVSAERRGEAIGTYGLAIAVPNLVILPAGPWVAESLGYGFTFVLSALPLVGIPAALRLASVLRLQAPDPHRDADESAPHDGGYAAHLRLLRPMLLLLAVTLAGGAVITFAPQMVDNAGVAAAGLFVMGLSAALSRWRIGVLADRRGAQLFLAPLVILTAISMALVSWSVAGPQGTRRRRLPGRHAAPRPVLRRAAEPDSADVLCGRRAAAPQPRERGVERRLRRRNGAGLGGSRRDRRGHVLRHRLARGRRGRARDPPAGGAAGQNTVQSEYVVNASSAASPAAEDPDGPSAGLQTHATPRSGMTARMPPPTPDLAGRPTR